MESHGLSRSVVVVLCLVLSVKGLMDLMMMVSRWSTVVGIEALFPTLESGIEEAVRVFRRQQQDKEGLAPDHGDVHRRHVKVVKDLRVVQGTPFYGYHKAPVLFIKVTLFDPRLLSRVASALQSGAILDTAFQPYEAHIPFLLQLFVDYNIAGMGYLHIHNQNTTLRFRRPLPDEPSFNELDTINNPLEVNVRYRVWLRHLVPSYLIFGGEGPQEGDESKGSKESMDETSSTRPTPPCAPAPNKSPRRDSSALAEEVSNLLDGLGSQELFHWSQAPQSSEIVRPAPPADPDVAPPDVQLSSVRSTMCELELDVHVCDIMNPQLLPRGQRLDSQPLSQQKDQGQEHKEGDKAKKGQVLTYLPSLREIWEEEMGRRSEAEDAEVSMTDLCLTAESDQMASQRGSSFVDAQWALKELYTEGRRIEGLSQDSSVRSSSQESGKALGNEEAVMLSQVSALPLDQFSQQHQRRGLSQQSYSHLDDHGADVDTKSPAVQFSQAQVWTVVIGTK